MKKIIRITTLLLALISTNAVQAQMEIIDGNTPPVDPVSLITNIFLGDGVEVLSVTYEGDPIAVGYFTNGQNAVGIDRGIVMTTGRAASNNCNAAPLGANCNGNQFASSDNASSATDADLQSLTNGNGALDVAKFTITFIPTADTLRFRYVFGSEEYPEYSCTSFNDVFGFFISGPGITGPYTNNGANIALIPGTNIPVTINNIHPPNPPNCNMGAYDQYYNNNQVAMQPVYDGYLDVFTATAVVIPCETYTIKLAISDAGDQIFDTGVFLEAKSFGTPSLEVELATVSLDGTITEGCATGSISFTFPYAVEEDFLLDYTIIGTAQNGVDYLEIPPDLFIPEGDSSITIDIVALDDLIDEGLESIGIDIQRDICNRDTFWLYIRDNEIVPPDLGLDQLICDGDSVQLDGTLPIPLPVPPSFTNAQDYPITFGSPAYSPIQVIGVQPITLGPGVIQSVCLNIDHNWVDDLDLFLISPAGQFIELSTDNGSNCDDYNNVCFTPTATNSIGAGFPWPPCSSGGQPSFANGTFAPEGVWTDIWDGEYPTNGTWQLLLIDDSQGFSGTLLDWTITFEPLYQLFYQWSPSTGLSCDDCPDPVAAPSQTTTYTLTAWDTYGCEVYDSVTIEVLNVLPAPVITCTNVTNNSITFEWNDVPNSMGYMVSINGGAFTVPNNGALSHIINGLTLDETVTIEVFGIGQCDGQIGTATCETPSCDAPSLTIVSQNNLLCAGDTNGDLSVQASGGAGNYTYSLDSISNMTGIFTGLSAGVYPVTVIDDWMCPNTIQVTISEPEVLDFQPVPINDISCFGSNDGSATVDISGGTWPFQFVWGNNETDSIATALTPGTTTLDVTDANGCSFSTSFDILEPPVLLATATADSVDCFTASTGSVLVSPSGGTAPLLVQWGANAGNADTELVENLPAGTYNVVVTDLNGCTVAASATIEEPDGMTSTVSFTQLSCSDSGDGTATIEVLGGLPDYQFEWSNGDTEATADLLNDTTYTVTVTDANGCSIQNSVNVTAPPPLVISLLETDALCFGEASGTVAASALGGAGNYTFVWNTGVTSPNLPAVPAGNYCATVTDGNGCTNSLCIDVGQPTEIMLTTTPTNAGCDGGTEGEIDLSVSGGTGPYTYIWSNGQTMQDLTGLAANSYTVTVTDANDCSATVSETISETDAISIVIDQNNAVLCKNGSSGSISITASGGTGIFTYTWSGPNGYSSDAEDINGLAAGSYTIVAEDSDGCSAQVDILVTEPPTAVALTIAPPNEICFGANNGQATASTTGGVPGYNYLWSNGQTTAQLNNVPAGSYTVTATDMNGCSAVGQVQIVQQGQLSLSLSQTSASCHGGTDGTATITSLTQGGNNLPFSNVQIQWSFANANTSTVSGLTGGQTYSVTVTTNNLGCTATASITIDDPAEIGAALVSSTDVRCFAGNDGTATVTGQGGTLPYSYLWDATANGQTTATATDLSNGSYTVTVSDANGCSTVFSTVIGQPTALGLGFQNQKVKCAGGADGSSRATASGGSPPYSYAWANGQNGSEATGLSVGPQTVTVTDANGCTLEMTTDIEEPMPVLAEYVATDVTCFGDRNGRIEIEVEGGSPPYRYSLNGGAFSGSPTFIALGAGIYDVAVQDNNGCIFELADMLVNEPPLLEIDLGPDTTVFYGQGVEIVPDITGLSPDLLATLHYDWYSNNPLNPVLFPNGPTGLFLVESPTTVTLEVTTSTGCTAEDIMNLFVIENREVVVPTGFSPGTGGAGENDLLHVHGRTQMVEKIALFQVFDRWGTLMYEATDFQINDLNIGWDGTFKGQDMPSGVYVWYLKVDYIDGDEESLQGHTTLIR